MRQMSRRKLLRRGTQAVLAGGVALSGIPALEPRAFSKSAPPAVDYYQKLGVTPFINAAGTYTALSASTMPDEVQAALALAAQALCHRFHAKEPYKGAPGAGGDADFEREISEFVQSFLVASSRFQRRGTTMQCANEDL